MLIQLAPILLLPNQPGLITFHGKRTMTELKDHELDAVREEVRQMALDPTCEGHEMAKKLLRGVDEMVSFNGQWGA